MQIKVVERSQQIQVQEQEISRREKELHATVKQPAEAERYRLETIANANMLVTLSLSNPSFPVYALIISCDSPFKLHVLLRPIPT